MSVHEGVKYQCFQCDSKFTLKGSLKKHKLSVHEGVKYPCNQCDSQYSSKKKMMNHFKSKHAYQFTSVQTCVENGTFLGEWAGLIKNKIPEPERQVTRHVCRGN